MDNRNLGSGPVEIFWRIDEWFPDLKPETLARLKRLHTELLQFNKTVNLISIKTMPMADVTHFADSIIASNLIHNSKAPKEIYDFGSGNGFPGLVYAILYPETIVRLVEVDQRKAEYLRHCAASLQLKNVAVLVRMVESLGENSIEFGMSRGLTTITKALLMSRKSFKRGGSLFHLKSEEWATEVAGIPSQLCSFWLPSLVGEYKLPVGSVKFAVVATEKIAD